MFFASIEEAADELKEGRMIIIVDDEDRENEGDLVCAEEVIVFFSLGSWTLCSPTTDRLSISHFENWR